MGYLDELQDAIRDLHGSESSHVSTINVLETFQGQTVWQGDVELFALHSHPKAERCYAWAHETDKGKRYVVVLELPPVDSAQKAVRAAIVEEAKKKR
jgi:hypothetical protein